MNSTRNVKMFAAIIGGSALVTVGAMSAAMAQDSTGGEIATGSTMTVGATSTETTPSAAPGVAHAEPAIKGPAPFKVGN